MTHEGVKKALFLLTTAYPNYKPENMAGTIAVWESLLKEYPDDRALSAVRAYIVGNPSAFAPSIGQIVDLMHAAPDEATELEAWGLVNRAIRNGTYGAEEEYNRLPEVIRLAVGSAGQIREWAKMDLDEVQTVAQSNFLRSYRAAVERQKKAERMPEDYARLYRRTPEPAQIEAKEERAELDGVPMPEEIKRRFEEWING